MARGVVIPPRREPLTDLIVPSQTRGSDQEQQIVDPLRRGSFAWRSIGSHSGRINDNLRRPVRAAGLGRHSSLSGHGRGNPFRRVIRGPLSELQLNSQATDILACVSQLTRQMLAVFSQLRSIGKSGAAHNPTQMKDDKLADPLRRPFFRIAARAFLFVPRPHAQGLSQANKRSHGGGSIELGCIPQANLDSQQVLHLLDIRSGRHSARVAQWSVWSCPMLPNPPIISGWLL
jgi:hypothetical protein